MISGSFILSFSLISSETSLLVPCAEKAAQNDEFAEMIGGVVGDEQGFAEKILAVAPAEGLEEIGFGLADEGFEVFEVLANGGDGGVPGVCGGWLGRFRPVRVGPLEGMIAACGWRAEVEDVALGDAEMLEQLPGGVGEIGWHGAAMFDREIFDGFVEGDVGLASAEESKELFAQFGRCIGFDSGGFGCAHRFPQQLDASGQHKAPTA